MDEGDADRRRERRLPSDSPLAGYAAAQPQRIGGLFATLLNPPHDPIFNTQLLQSFELNPVIQPAE